MSRTKKNVIAVFVVILAAGVGVWSASPNRLGVLVLEEGSTEFRLAGDGKYQGTAVIRNTGDGPATIERIDTGCGCTSVVASNLNMGPDDTCQLTFDVTASSAPSKVVYADLIRGLVRIAPTCVIVGQFRTQPGDQRFGKLSVKAVGEVALPIALPAGELNVGDVVASAGKAERDIGIRAVRSFKNVNALSLAKGVIARVAQSDGDLKLTMAIAPEEVDDIFRAQYGGVVNVRLSGVVESGMAVSLVVPVRIKVIPPVNVSPSRLIAGPMRTGESLTRELMFRPDGLSLKSITRIEIEGEASVSVQKIEPGKQSTRATLRIDGEAVTATDGEAVFVCTDDFGGESRVTVPISVVVKL